MEAAMREAVLACLRAPDGPRSPYYMAKDSNVKAVCGGYPLAERKKLVREALEKLSLRGLAIPLGAGQWMLQPQEDAEDEDSTTQGYKIVLEDVPAGARRPDPSQEKVIKQCVGARQIVQAGPGFGKTDVACARVVYLIEEEDIGAHHILLLSFTRTAVREMRNRIRELARKGKDVSGVEVSTLDSFAWRLRTGLSTNTQERWSYEESIREVVRMLGDPSDEVREYLDDFQHIFVDEAQDLVGPRAELVKLLLNRHPESAGWTVFLDPAQAIYGWAEDEIKDAYSGLRFTEMVDELDQNATRRKLKILHRTNDQTLRDFLLSSRKEVLRETPPLPCLPLREELSTMAGARSLTHEAIFHLVEELGEQADSSLILYRTRGEVLTASSYLSGRRTPHRLRFGGTPEVVAPWVAATINAAVSERESATFRRSDFRDAWEELQGSWLIEGWDEDTAWQTLRRLGKDRSHVSAEKIADRLSRGRVPDNLFLKEIGSSGPILGTVHGSKGREAPVVVVGVPPEDRYGEMTDDQDREEARVLYVALSRAKQALLAAKTGKAYNSYTEERRVWSSTRRSGKWKRFRVEIGRGGDLDPVRSLLAADEGPEAQQAFLSRYDGSIRQLKIYADGAHDWRRRLILEEEGAEGEGMGLAALSNSCEKDLGWIKSRVLKKKKRGAAPNFIQFVWWRDLTTVAVPRDTWGVVDLPEPWRTSRMWMMPVVAAYGLAYCK